MKRFLVIVSIALLFVACSGESESGSNLVSVPSVDQNVGSDEPTEDTQVVTPSLVSISLVSSATNFIVGSDVQLYATGVYSDGSQSNITSTATFTSSNAGIVSVSNSIATGVSAGIAQIAVSLGGVSSQITLVSFSATLVDITLSTNNISLPSDGESQVKVFAQYDNNQTIDVTNQASLSSQNVAISTISSSGLVEAISPGSTTLDISFGGFNKSVAINITSSVISSIQVTPIIGSKGVGTNQNFIATASLSDGTTLNVTNSVVWSSSNTSVLSIDATGLAQLLSPGIVTVSAELNGATSSVNFEVLNKTLESISMDLAASSISVGLSTKVVVTAHYSDASTQDISDSVAISLSDNSVALINQGLEVSVSALAIGSTNIVANFSGRTTSETLTISGATLVSIEVQSKYSLLSSGVNAYFSAIGTYDDASVVDITDSVTWNLSNTAYGTISNSPLDKGLYTNTFSDASTSSLTITATLGGVSDDLEVIMAPGTISDISITPSSVTTRTNKNIDYKAYAHFSDGASVEITDIVTWSSSDSDVALVSNAKVDAGRVSTLSEGSGNIQATYNGLSSNVSVMSVDNSAPEIIPEEGGGLLASYYSGRSFNTLMGQRIDGQIDFNWSTGEAPLGVGNNFSVRWTGQIKGKYTGNCQVSSRSDDGFRMWIGGNSIIDVWFDHAPRWDHNYSVAFVEGEKQTITVEFYENGGHAVAELYWQCPGDTTLDPIPMEYLFSE